MLCVQKKQTLAHRHISAHKWYSPCETTNVCLMEVKLHTGLCACRELSNMDKSQNVSTEHFCSSFGLGLTWITSSPAFNEILPLVFSCLEGSPKLSHANLVRQCPQAMSQASMTLPERLTEGMRRIRHS